MTHFIKLCSQTLCLILLSVFASGQSVRAHNLPGSAQGALSETTEIATGMIVRSLKDDIRPMRTDGPSVQISTMGDSGGATGTTGFSATTGGVTPLTFGLNYRDVTTSRTMSSTTARLSPSMPRRGNVCVPPGLWPLPAMVSSSGVARVPHHICRGARYDSFFVGRHDEDWHAGLDR